MFATTREEADEDGRPGVEVWMEVLFLCTLGLKSLGTPYRTEIIPTLVPILLSPNVTSPTTLLVSSCSVVMWPLHTGAVYPFAKALHMLKAAAVMYCCYH